MSRTGFVTLWTHPIDKRPCKSIWVVFTHLDPFVCDFLFTLKSNIHFLALLIFFHTVQCIYQGIIKIANLFSLLCMVPGSFAYC